MAEPVPTRDEPSMESLVESGVIELESLHPGGLSLTAELASLCGVTRDTRVLDVACGTGESARYLAQALGAKVCGVDMSEALLARARAKVASSGLHIDFFRGDAQALPFADGTFDAAICECTICLLEKTTALKEMVRVVRPGGCVGIHDLYWSEHAPDALKRRLLQNEGEAPETLDGWKQLFTDAGLIDVRAVDRSEIKRRWMRDTRAELGLSGQFRLGVYAARRWGLGGLWRILSSERTFSSHHLGYALVVGTRA